MQSYPSPSAAAADNGGPFYSSSNSQNQQQSGLQNPDDLQLTAQLTNEIGSIMTVSQNGTIPENQASRGQSHGNGRTQYDNEHDHTHLQPTSGSLDSVGRHYRTSDDMLAPRKRTKVSRACDECRRKKIRCDATTEQSNENCSNCKRVGARCQFSRIPMKRGPSKGYIKELADRLHTLEGVVHSGEIVQQYLPQVDHSLGRNSEELSPPPNVENMLRKRRMSAATDFGAYLPQKPLPPWNSHLQDASRHIPNSSSEIQAAVDEGVEILDQHQTKILHERLQSCLSCFKNNKVLKSDLEEYSALVEQATVLKRKIEARENSWSKK